MGASGRRFQIVTIRGIPIFVATSWLVVVGLYLFIEIDQLTASPWNPSSGEAVGLAILSSVIFFGGVLLHEAAHAIVARSFDLPVAGITLVFWGGATETRASAKGPLAEFLVTAAGPATTLALALILFAVEGRMEPSLAREIVRNLAFLNLLFAGLNALPGFPLDGGRMLLAATWGITRNRQTALKVAGVGGMVVGALFIAGAILALQDEIFGRAIFFGYLGVILFATGRSMPKQVALRERLAPATVADAMRPPPAAVPATISLTEALDHGLRGDPEGVFPVVDAGRVIGTVSMDSARKVGSRDPSRPVRDGMLPLNRTTVLAPGDALDDAFDWLAGKPALVLRDGILVGELHPEDVERWYRSRYEGYRDDEPSTWAPLSGPADTGDGGGETRDPRDPPRRPDL